MAANGCSDMLGKYIIRIYFAAGSQRLVLILDDKVTSLKCLEKGHLVSEFGILKYIFLTCLAVIDLTYFRISVVCLKDTK